MSSDASSLAVVLTHGFADDSSTFDALVEHLGARHPVVRWDLPGHGGAPVGPEPATRETALAGLSDAVESAGASPVVLVGHSLGGYLSMLHAIHHPEQVAALVLVSTGPGFRNPEKRAAWNESISAVAVKRGVPPLAAGIAGQADSLVLDRLDALTMPVLVIVGSRDTTYHAGSQLLERSLPDARLVVVDGAGHFPHRTHVDYVNAIVNEFLATAISPT